MSAKTFGPLSSYTVAAQQTLGIGGIFFGFYSRRDGCRRVRKASSRHDACRRPARPLVKPPGMSRIPRAWECPPGLYGPVAAAQKDPAFTG